MLCGECSLPAGPVAGVLMRSSLCCCGEQVRIPRIEGWTPDSGYALLDRFAAIFFPSISRILPTICLLSLAGGP